MESVFLKSLSKHCEKYKYVLVYGAGGVAENLLILLEPYFHQKDICIVVSDKSSNKPSLQEYPVREISEFCGIFDEVYVIIAVMPRHTQKIKAHLENQGFSNYCTVSELIEELYREIWASPVEKDKILFVNGSGWGFGGNPKYIALDLLEADEGLDLVWASKNMETRLPQRMRLVEYGSYEHYYELGTAGIWIDNQHKSFFTRKRNGQIYIQTWHGGGPLKKIEFDVEGLPGSYLDLCEMNSEMQDIMISPSKFNSMLYRRAFHYHGEILECGYPRNDIFWKTNACRQKIETHCHIRQGEGIVLFAPTFREAELKGVETLDLGKMRSAFVQRFGKEYKVLVRCHPSDKESVQKYKGCGEWVNVTDYDDPQELLAAADILVTDYSSIMWDFSLQKKPVFLFHPDLHLYEEERGYYLPFGEMPYVEAFSNEEICKKIIEFDYEAYRNEMAGFLEDYGSFDKGTAARAVTDRIMRTIKKQHL